MCDCDQWRDMTMSQTTFWRLRSSCWLSDVWPAENSSIVRKTAETYKVPLENSGEQSVKDAKKGEKSGVFQRNEDDGWPSPQTHCDHTHQTLDELLPADTAIRPLE